MRADGETLADRILERVIGMDDFGVEDIWDLPTCRDIYRRSRCHYVLAKLVAEGLVEVVRAPRPGPSNPPGRWRYRQ